MEGALAEQQLRSGTDIELDSGFKVRDLAKILRLAWDQEQCYFDSCGPSIRKCCGSCNVVKHETQQERLPSVSHQLDLNVASVPDLNEEFNPPIESSRDEGNGYTVGQAVEADDDAFSHDIHRKSGEIPAVNSKAATFQKRTHSSKREMQDSDSTLTNGPHFKCSMNQNAWMRALNIV